MTNSESTQRPSKELVERIRDAYDKVKVFPESRPDGFMDLIALRNLVGDWLRVNASETGCGADVDYDRGYDRGFCAGREAALNPGAPATPVSLAEKINRWAERIDAAYGDLPSDRFPGPPSNITSEMRASVAPVSPSAKAGEQPMTLGRLVIETARGTVKERTVTGKELEEIRANMARYFKGPLQFREPQTDSEGPVIYDANGNQVAMLYWPCHPVEETAAAEQATYELGRAMAAAIALNGGEHHGT